MSKTPILTGNITNNNAEIVAAFNNTLSRDGSLPNTMEAALDMNNKRILNNPDPTDPTHLVTLQYGTANYGTGAIAASAASAAAAAISATNASNSAGAAAASATSAGQSAAQLIGTSVTPITIGAGSKTFATQTGKFFAPGTDVIITNNANPAVDFMAGRTTLYFGTQLDVNVLATGGAGTFADWTIRVAGTRGAQGATGAPGAGTGDMLRANNLSDLIDFATARANLGLGSAAVQAATDFLLKANNLSDLTNTVTARTNLGLGTAAVLNVGTGANNILQLNGSSQIPAVDGSLLTGITATGGVVLISSQAASGLTEILFSAIPQIYGSLLLSWVAVNGTASTASWIAHINGVTGSAIYKNIDGIAVTNQDATGSVAFQAGGGIGDGYFQIDAYNGSTYKPFNSFFSYGAGGNDVAQFGRYPTIAGITTLRLLLQSAGTFTAGTFSLHGIK